MRTQDCHKLGPWARLAIPACAVAAVHVLRIPHVIVDDAYISFRYADKLVAGEGLVFNPGEHVEGYSNFLWVVLTAAFRAVGCDPVGATRALGAASIIGIILVTTGLTWRLTRLRAAAATAAMLLATSTALCASALAGLETGLFALWATLAAAMFLTQRPAAASLLWGLATLTRPEGAALWIIAMTCQALARQRKPREYWYGLATPCAAILCALFAFRLWYYGEWMPNSVVAKSAMLPLLSNARLAEMPGIILNRNGLLYVFRFIAVSVGILIPLAIVPLALALDTRPTLRVAAAGWRTKSAAACQGLARTGPTLRVAAAGWRTKSAAACQGLTRTRRLAAAYLSAMVLLGCAISVYNFGDWMTAFRLLTPYLPALAVLVCWGAVALVTRIQTTTGAPLRAKAGMACAAVALVGCLGGWQADMPEFVPPPDEELAAVLEHSRQADLLMATDVLGRLGYYAPHVRVLDMAGLADAYIARHGETKPTLGKWNLPYVLSQHPHLLMTNVLDAWHAALRDPAFNMEYVWMDEPSWRPGVVSDVQQRVVYVRSGSTLHDELRAAYPAALWRRPNETEPRFGHGQY